MASLPYYLVILMALLTFSSGVRHLRDASAGNLDRVCNLALLPFILPSTISAFESLSTASSVQVFVFVSGILGCVGAALSIATLPSIKWRTSADKLAGPDV